MSTVRAMDFSFREIAVVFFAATLIFFCSCERHHPSELAPEPKSEAASLEPAAGSHSAATVTPTPAEFFPASTPR
ncbi:MAG: hypothetical protein M3R10_00985 [Verrucomicrobiota bacterium]|nr:hypothetical protein [Verrucomicrobiota bacterium]